MLVLIFLEHMSSFTGSGAGLTSIPGPQLTGSLPAIDGSNLIGVIASGTGIEIKDSDSVVGSAGTVNFGDGLTVSPVSAGVVTVTASGGSLQSRTIVSHQLLQSQMMRLGLLLLQDLKFYIP